MLGIFVLLLWVLQVANGIQLLALTENCRIHYSRYLTALESKEHWAYLMFDGSGRVESGISGGNLVFEGDYSTCQKVLENTSNANAVKGLYCMITWFGINGSDLDDMKGYGFCVPHSCTDDDASILAHNYNPHNKPVSTRRSTLYCLRDKNISSDSAAMVTIFILALFGLAVILATVFDIVSSQKSKARNMKLQPNGSTDLDKHSQSECLTGNHYSVPIQTNVQEGTLSKILLCFSLYMNIPKLVCTKHPPGSFTCFSGIRLFSMIWIILGHTYFIATQKTPISAFSNRYSVFPKGYGHEFINQMVLPVESFFIMSSILATVSFLQRVEQQNGKLLVKQMIFYYCHRYLRQTPVYAVVLMVFYNLFQYLGTGPLFTPYIPENTFCKSRSWQKMMYIDSLIYSYQECAGWTWYLTFDFQYYSIAPLFLYPAYWVWKRKKSLLWAALIILTGYLGNLLANVILNLMSTYGKLTESWVHAVSHRPWTRATSYFLGMTLGYCLYNTKAKLKLSKHTLTLGWVLSVLFVLISIFGNHFITWPRDATLGPQPGVALFISIKTTLFALAVLWIIFVCSLGQGGVVNTILSCNTWVPLAKLSYVAYLVHPIIQYYFIYTSPVQIYFYDWLMMYLFLGHLVLSLAAAFIITLVFEMPFLNMNKVIFKQYKKAKAL